MNMQVYAQAALDLLRWEIVRYWLMAVGITALGFILLWGSVFGGLYTGGASIHGWASGVTGLPLPNWLIDPLVGGFIAMLVAASWFATTYFFSVILLLVLGFFTPPLVRQVRLIHYPGLRLPRSGNLLDDFMVLLGIVCKYLVLLLGLLLLSIPFFPLAPLFFTLWGLLLFRRLLLADVTSQIAPGLSYKERRQGMWFASLIAYALSLVPVLNLIAPIYGVVLVSHLMLDQLSQEQQAPPPTGDEEETEEIIPNILPRREPGRKANLADDEASGD